MNTTQPSVQLRIQLRIDIEKKIVRAFCLAAMDAGYTCQINNGDDETGPFSNLTLALKHLFLTDQDVITLYDHFGKQSGWAHMVYGNDGWDVIHDYSINVESLMAEPHRISEMCQ